MRKRRVGKKPLSFLGGLSSFVGDRAFPLYLTCLLVVLHLINTFLVRNNVAQIPLGFFAVFFAPGYVWLDVLSGRNRISEGSERIITAIALSIGLVIMSVTFLSLALRVPLTKETVVLTIAAVSALGLGVRKIFPVKVSGL